MPAQQALDVSRWHMAFDGVAADFGGVARTQAARHFQPGAGGIGAFVDGFDGEAGGLQRRDHAARQSFVILHQQQTHDPDPLTLSLAHEITIFTRLYKYKYRTSLSWFSFVAGKPRLRLSCQLHDSDPG